MIEMAVENIKAVVAHFRLDNGIGFVSNSIGPYSIPENRVTRVILDFVDFFSENVKKIMEMIKI